VGEAGRYSRGFFFGFTEEDGELLYRGHGDIPAIVTGQKGLYELLVSCPTGIDQQLQKTQLSELRDQQDPRTLPFKSRKKRADAMTCQWGGRRRRCKELGIEVIIWSWGRGGETTTAHAAPYCDMINARVDWLGGGSKDKRAGDEAERDSEHQPVRSKHQPNGQKGQSPAVLVEPHHPSQKGLA
jgi:hypothetical protein